MKQRFFLKHLPELEKGEQMVKGGVIVNSLERVLPKEESEDKGKVNDQS